MKVFYYFEDLVYQPQVKSKWCWAACGSMISNFYKNQINDNQSHFVISKYNSLKNRYIKISEINNLYNKFNIKCIQKEKAFIQNFELVKNTLIETRSPIILGVEIRNKLKHLVLVVGYGECDSKNYLLIYDPNSNQIYNHYDNNNFEYDGNKISHVWVTGKNNNSIGNQLKKLRKTNSISNIIPQFKRYSQVRKISLTTKSFLGNSFIENTKEMAFLVGNNHFLTYDFNEGIVCEDNITLTLASQGDLNNILGSIIKDNLLEFTKFTFYSNTGVFIIESEINNKLYERVINIPQYELNNLGKLSQIKYEKKFLTNKN
ncbi:C39 family peptidase [Polaribacter haliotis]|uniref:C39 family peptidase n=1 Tax=Polaribacter haliotis TaxID=1888915 RepID=A0A7L8AHL6_9FLAO|nr:papain-like cysteine protease family protein [Polaribacter haliotis]QOD61487.1 C39 family peptidase [Polaribacter haliotis]